MSTHRPPTRARFWLLQTGLAAGWVAVWHVGRLLEQTELASLWFPPAALTFALFATIGAWALLPVTVGAVVTTFQSAALHGDARPWSALLLSGLAFALAHSLAYGSGARLFARFRGRDRLVTPRSVVIFLAVATASSLVAAVAGLASLVATGTTVAGGFRADLVTWWIGDLVAVVALAPLLIIVTERLAVAAGLPSSGWTVGLQRIGPGRSSRGRYLLKLAAAVALVVVLGALSRTDLDLPVALLAYVLIVPLMWIAHTEGGLRTLLAVAVLASAVVVVTRWFGPATNVFEYQAAMLTIAGVGLFNLTVPRLSADNERLRHVASIDPLTGARSRAAFLEGARDLLDRRHDGGPSVSVVLFDLDHFKSVNDSFGHAVGDAVLVRTGAICRDEVRTRDLFGRLGGEEFALVLPDASLAAARNLADRLRCVFEATDWGTALAGRAVTASFGVAEARSDESLAEVLDRADTALYRAKADGRNTVRVG